MTTPNSVIPAEQSADYSSWQMPEVKDGQIVRTEKLRNRRSGGQTVTVDKNEIIYSSLTAGQLEEITQQAYEEVRQQAYEEGRQSGYQDGHQAGVEAGQQAVAQQVAALHQTIGQLYSYLGGQDDEVEQALVNLAACVSQSVLRRELTIDSTQIRQVVREAVALLPMQAKNICVYLSEQDHQLLTEHSDVEPQWSLRVDTSLTPGGCRVTSEHSMVDYTLEEQFQQTINELVQARFTELAAQAKARNEQRSHSGGTLGGQPDDADT